MRWPVAASVLMEPLVAWPLANAESSDPLSEPAAAAIEDPSLLLPARKEPRWILH
jgi:hypothetical protein